MNSVGSHFSNSKFQPKKRINFLSRVAAHFGGRILFLTCKGELDVPAAIVTASKVAGPNDDQSGEAPGIAVGDWFLLDKVNHRALRRLERKTLISRKAAGEEVKPQLIAANVDTLFIVSSCNQDFNLTRVERYLALALESDANLMKTVVFQLEKQWKVLPDKGFKRFSVGKALYPN